MKKYAFLLLALSMMLFMQQGVLANKTGLSILQTNIYPSEVSIEVPDVILLPDSAPGYASEYIGFDVLNSGTSDIYVDINMQGDDQYQIYDNIKLKKDLSDNPSDWREFNFTIKKPAVVGSSRVEKIFVSLDLSDYPSNVFYEDLQNYTREMLFIAMPAI